MYNCNYTFWASLYAFMQSLTKYEGTLDVTTCNSAKGLA